MRQYLSLRLLARAALGLAVALCGCSSSSQQQHPATAADLDADETEASDMDPSALSDFREPLDPYGTWMDDPTWGTVWVPSGEAIGTDFTPYVTAGHWALTADDQWMWVSDYPWGWAPFHYGRWIWIDGTGWAWIPGRVYAPAWVVWRTGEFGEPYVGWSPMPPAWCWRSGVAVRVAVVPAPRYVFVPSRYVFGAGLRAHVVAKERMQAVMTRTQPYSAAPAGGRHTPLTATHGPTLAAAKVPAAAVPAQRAQPDPRAVAYRRAVAEKRQNAPAQRGRPGAEARPGAAGASHRQSPANRTGPPSVAPHGERRGGGGRSHGGGRR
jgi:Family of unknown function (DUF6600)